MSRCTPQRGGRIRERKNFMAVLPKKFGGPFAQGSDHHLPAQLWPLRETREKVRTPASGKLAAAPKSQETDGQ
jgi:hypothetical protein